MLSLCVTAEHLSIVLRPVPLIKLPTASKSLMMSGGTRPKTVFRDLCDKQWEKRAKVKEDILKINQSSWCPESKKVKKSKKINKKNIKNEILCEKKLSFLMIIMRKKWFFNLKTNFFQFPDRLLEPISLWRVCHGEMKPELETGKSTGEKR